MDMKRILQAMDGVATKPVAGASDMSKFLAIVDKNASIQILTEASNPHKVSLPVQMAMQHYQKEEPVPVERKARLIDKYLNDVEQEFAEQQTSKRQLINQYASIIAERVLIKESKKSKIEKTAQAKALKELESELKISHHRYNDKWNQKDLDESLGFDGRGAGPGPEVTPSTGGHFDLGMSEQGSDQVKKVIKKHGKPVGEIGIDPEASPGGGEWYMKHYASGIDNSGYDSYEDALDELKYCVKHHEQVAESKKNTSSIKHINEMIRKNKRNVK